jgi:hypothetical protein
MIITTNTIGGRDNYPQVDFECGTSRHNNLSGNNAANIIYYGNYVHVTIPRGRVTIINSNTVGREMTILSWCMQL